MSGEETTASRGFVIEEVEYALPTVGSFDLDEAQILYDYSGMTLEDFAPDEDGHMSDERALEIAERMKNPGFLRTLLHVAYQRGNPSVADLRVRKLIGKLNFGTYLSQWIEALEADDPSEDPTAQSTSELEQSSPRSSVGSNTSFGFSDSESDSAEPGELPESIGITKSDTSSPGSDPTT